MIAMMQTRSTQYTTVLEDPNEAHIIKCMTQSYERAQQEEAFKELLKLIGANGGKLTYGAMDPRTNSHTLYEHAT
jgi:hypothetical protein